MIYKNAL